MGINLKILYLTFRVPYPLYSGYAIRSFNLGKILASRYQVDLVSLGNKKTEKDSIDHLEKVFNKVIIFPKSKHLSLFNVFLGIFSQKPLQVSYYYSKDFQKWIDLHQREYDIVFCSTIRTADYVKETGCKKVIDFIDAISLHYQKGAKVRKNIIWKLVYFLEGKRLLSYERKLLNFFDLSLVVSSFDKNFISGKPSGKNNFLILPNGVNPAYLKEEKKKIEEKDNLVFFGKMDYYPNKEAVGYFLKNVFPALKKKIPNIEFLIIGSFSEKLKNLEAIPGVRIIGFVEDPSTYLRQAKAIVVPLRMGAGIQNKVIEAMALGRVVVSSPIGVRGIKGENKLHFLVAQDDKAFVDEIIDVFSDSRKRAYIGKNAKELIQKEYTWEKIEKDLLNYINKLSYENKK